MKNEKVDQLQISWSLLWTPLRIVALMLCAASVVVHIPQYRAPE